jgi:hypothetical protein
MSCLHRCYEQRKNLYSAIFTEMLMDLILQTMSQLMAASQHQYRLRRADWYNGEFIGLHFGGVGFQIWGGTTGYPDRTFVLSLKPPERIPRYYQDR